MSFLQDFRSLMLAIIMAWILFCVTESLIDEIRRWRDRRRLAHHKGYRAGLDAAAKVLEEWHAEASAKEYGSMYDPESAASDHAVRLVKALREEKATEPADPRTPHPPAAEDRSESSPPPRS